MRCQTHLVALALLLTLQGGYAQQLYKSVGPDGRVSYSDKPPAGATYSVIQAALEPRPPAAEESTPAASAKAAEPAQVTGREPLPGTAPATAKAADAPRQATTQAPAAPKDEPKAPVVDEAQIKDALALADAIGGALSMDSLVKQTEDLCIATLPTSMKKYSGAAADWRKRNGQLVAQARQILRQEMQEPARQRVEQEVAAQVKGMMKPVQDAPWVSRIKWCDQSVQEMGSAAMDLAGKEKIAGPLANFKPK